VLAAAGSASAQPAKPDRLEGQRPANAPVAASAPPAGPGAAAAAAPKVEASAAPAAASPPAPSPELHGPEASLRYLIEEIEIQGNTRTRRRVVEHFVPFHRGDVLDVDDPALELTRYRLLGTGFFRDVQLSLRKGSARGRVILVIEVTERNTLVVTDLAMGLSADTD